MANRDYTPLYSRYVEHEKRRVRHANGSPTGSATQVDRSMGHLLGRSEFESYFATLTDFARESVCRELGNKL